MGGYRIEGPLVPTRDGDQLKTFDDHPDISPQYVRCRTGEDVPGGIFTFHLIKEKTNETVGFCGIARRPLYYPDECLCVCEVSVEYVYLKEDFRNQGLSDRFHKPILEFFDDWLKEVLPKASLNSKKVLIHGSPIASEPGLHFARSFNRGLEILAEAHGMTFEHF